ncbi:MAG: FKBP-type peptidyl-prolyl cis-trans isomerase [Saprospiraceae bacterium]|nr:FKBP-type peptidyl-prolyl cis-trans isomerase [Saprospiraceae bacterium]
MLRLSGLFAAALCLLGLNACIKDDQRDLDRNAILSYLTNNNLSATEHESGIFYILDTPGSGGHPGADAKVTVKYKAFYLDDTLLDETEADSTATFNLAGLIEGWRIAIPLLQKGGKGTFWIPSGLAYGSNPPFGVQPNAVLRFNIELIDFQ